MNAFFGEPWRDPALQGAERAATPVGKDCAWCVTPVEEGDQGFIIPCIRTGPDGPYASPEPWHRECEARSLAGSIAHLDGRCSCCGGTEDPADRPRTPRQRRAEALEVWRRLRAGTEKTEHSCVERHAGPGLLTADPPRNGRLVRPEGAQASPGYLPAGATAPDQTARQRE